MKITVVSDVTSCSLVKCTDVSGIPAVYLNRVLSCWRQQGPLKRERISTRPHSITSCNTSVLIWWTRIKNDRNTERVQLKLYKTAALLALLHGSETSRVRGTKGIRIENKRGDPRQLAATLDYMSIMGSTTKVFSCWFLTLEVRVWSQPSRCRVMWWTKWHWDKRVFSDYIGFPWSQTFHN